MKRLWFLLAALLLLFLAAGTGKANAHTVAVGVFHAETVHEQNLGATAAAAVPRAVGANHVPAHHGGCTGSCTPCCAAACGAPSALSVAPIAPMVALAAYPQPALLSSQGDGVTPTPPAPPPRA